MAVTGIDQLDDTIIAKLNAKAQYTRMFNEVMQPLCWKVKRDKATAQSVPTWGTVTSRQLTEKVDITDPETMTDISVLVTPYEHGLKTIVTQNAIEDNSEDVIAAAGRMMGDAFERELDELLCVQLDSGTNSYGAANSTLTMGFIAAANAGLKGNPASLGGPAPLPYAGVIHPYQELDIVDIITPLAPAAGTTQSYGGSFADATIMNYFSGKLFGINLFTDGNIAIDSSDDAKGGVFSTGEGGAIIYMPVREPSVRSTPDESLRGYELVYVGRYGIQNHKNGWISEIYTDAGAPA